MSRIFLDKEEMSVTKFKVEVVSTLPTSNISSDTIYLKTINGESPNLYEEYIYVEGNFELIGSSETNLENKFFIA